MNKKKEQVEKKYIQSTDTKADLIMRCFKFMETLIKWNLFFSYNKNLVFGTSRI